MDDIRGPSEPLRSLLGMDLRISSIYIIAEEKEAVKASFWRCSAVVMLRLYYSMRKGPFGPSLQTKQGDSSMRKRIHSACTIIISSFPS